MLNILSELKDELLVRANESTSTATGALYTEAILNDWVDDAHKFAAAYKKWPFAEGRISTTLVSTQTDDLGNIVYDYPEGWKADSIRILLVGGKRLQKINHSDFLRFREEQSDSDDRIFSDFGRTYYINPKIDLSGTITLWGQYTPSKLDYTDSNATTIFSNNEIEGNEAIVELGLSYAKRREKKFTESALHFQKALEILDGILKRVQDEQFGYQSKDTGMFERFDILQGGMSDEVIKRDQWY